MLQEWCSVEHRAQRDGIPWAHRGRAGDISKFSFSQSFIHPANASPNLMTLHTLTRRLARRSLHTIQRQSTIHSAEKLLRNFIAEALYHPQRGYFVARSSAVGVLQKPLSFESMLDRSEYEAAVAAAYASSARSWYTPSELFQPFYSVALARHILRARQDHREEPLVVYELGGGRGTNARCFLDTVQRLSPEVYATLRYTNVEISAPLAEEQRAATVEHRAVQRVLHADATAASTWGPRDDAPCFIIALELLDNLPHDRVVFADGVWHETWVTQTHDGLWHEFLRPIEDPLVSRCLDIYIQTAANGSLLDRILARALPTTAIFLPTVCLGLLESLAAARPQHRLILSDFDSLPAVRIPGQNAPLVASLETGDYDSYLAAHDGAADIFFPTDFRLLQAMVADARQRSGARALGSGRVLRSAEFLEECLKPHELRQASTASGWNPLLHDFVNTRIYAD